MLNFSTQHKLCILPRFIVEQPVQLCPLRRSIAVLVLDGGAVDGNGVPSSNRASTRLVSML